MTSQAISVILWFQHRKHLDFSSYYSVINTAILGKEMSCYHRFCLFIYFFLLFLAVLFHLEYNHVDFLHESMIFCVHGSQWIPGWSKVEFWFSGNWRITEGKLSRKENIPSFQMERFFWSSFGSKCQILKHSANPSSPVDFLWTFCVWDPGNAFSFNPRLNLTPELCLEHHPEPVLRVHPIIQESLENPGMLKIWLEFCFSIPLCWAGFQTLQKERSLKCFSVGTHHL